MKILSPEALWQVQQDGDIAKYWPKCSNGLNLNFHDFRLELLLSYDFKFGNKMHSLCNMNIYANYQ